MKRLFDEFLELTGLRRRQMLVMVADALGGGALSAMLLALLSEALKRADQGGPGLPLFGAFAIALAACVLLQRRAARRMVDANERACETLRLRLLHAALCMPLLDNENTAPHVKRLLLTRDAVQLAGAIPVWVGMLGSVATVVGALGYLAWLSLRSAVVVLVVVVFAVITYQVLVRRTFVRMREAYDLANAGMGFADDLLAGTKELKLDPAYARQFWRDDVSATLRRASQATVDFKSTQQDVGLVGVVAFYGLTGLAAFGFQRWLGVDASVVGSVVLVLLFLQAHIQGMVQRLPVLADAGHAQQRIAQAVAAWEARSEGDLTQESGTAVKAVTAVTVVTGTWRTLRLEAVSFSYGRSDQPNSFRLRDVDLEVPRGAMVFIVGGNGSGKTTLAKLLLGLYRPESGRMLLDEVVLMDADMLAYRAGFCSVFSDVHLFRRLPPDGAGRQAQLRRTLDELALPLRLDAEGRVDVRALSQGQKKRMASAFAMADGRALCMFDEWTADQDSEFRQYFYESFLPRLRAEGRTVFVITHDDRQFHRADLLVRLDAGRIVEVVRQSLPGVPAGDRRSVEAAT